MKEHIKNIEVTFILKKLWTFLFFEYFLNKIIS